MVDTGLSLFQEGYRIGGATKPERFKKMDAVCRNPADNRRLMDQWAEFCGRVAVDGPAEVVALRA